MLHFCKWERQIRLSFEDVLLRMVLYAGSTPVGVSAYRKHAAGNSIERNHVYRTSKQSGQTSALESTSLPLPCNAVSHSLFLCISFFNFLYSLVSSASPDYSVSTFLQGDTLDMPRGKGNLFYTSSMHHIVVSLGSTSIKCDTDREAHTDLLQCHHSV